MKLKRFLTCALAWLLILPISLCFARAQTVAVPDPLVYTTDIRDPEGLEAAADQVREHLKKREETFLVSFWLPADALDGTSAAAEALGNRVTELAYAHTGVPNEGDYIRWHIGFIQPTVSCWQENGGWQVELDYYAVYYANAQQEAQLDLQIEALVDTLGLKSDLTEFQKLFAIYQYLCTEVDYDYEHLEDDTYIAKWSAYAAQVDKTAVCQGYALLFYRLALEAGLDNRIIVGYAGENHAWSMVRLEGQYYYLDSTWDAEGYDYRFFLRSAAEFWEHEAEDRYKTPEFFAAYPQAEASYQLPQQDNAVENGYEYRVMDGLAAIVRYTGTEKDVVVPATLGGYPVHWVSSGAFYGLNAMESITFSEGIRVIESEAILSCTALKSVHYPSTVDFTASKEPDFMCRVICGPSWCTAVETVTVAEGNPNVVVVDNVMYSADMKILRYYPAADPREYFEIPEGVQALGASAFARAANLKEVKMSNTVLRLQIGVFQECKVLKKVTISESCHYIDQYVFQKSGLESIHIPASVKMLYSGSFGYDSKISEITVDPNNPYYYLQDGVLYGHYSEENVTDSCHQPYLGDWLVRYPAGREEASFAVPEGIVGIEQCAFLGAANLTQITLPKSLQAIEGEAFVGCTRLIGLDLQEGLKEIGDQPFWDCSGLVELVIPASVEQLGYYVVGQGGCVSLENVVFLGDMPEMYDQTFAYLSMDIYYPAGNTTWASVSELYPPVEGCALNWIEQCESHAFAEKRMSSDCVHAGYTGRECTVCGLVEVTGDVTAPTGHDLMLVAEYEASCIGAGGTDYQCRTCGAYEFEYKQDSLGHLYQDGICIRCSLKEGAENEYATDEYVTDGDGSVQFPAGGQPAEDASTESVIWNMVAILGGCVVIWLICILGAGKKKTAEAAPASPEKAAEAADTP